MSLPADRTEVDPRLREEVRLLGDLLGGAIKQFEGEATFELVERVRALSKGARGGRREDAEATRALLASLDADRALPLARAFACFLQLANVAEQRDRALADRPHPGGGLEEALSALAREVGPARLRAALADQRVELVLTAHPTQVTRRTLLGKYRRLSAALERRAGATAALQREQAEADVRREVLAIWHTDELRRARPTPVDEARGGLALIEGVLWESLPAHLRELDRALRLCAGGEGLPLGAAPLSLGSWMGGDRDGNPNVTAAVTAEVLWMSRWMAASLHQREVAALSDELSMRAASPALRARVGDAAEPYRALLKQVLARLGATVRLCEVELARLRGGPPLPGPQAEPYLDAAELAADLGLCHASLCACGLDVIADGRLADQLRRVACFGLVLARLDLRQEASVHTQALDAITRALDLGSYAEWDEVRRREFLLAELASRRPLLPRDLPDDAALREVLDTLAVAAAAPPGGLGVYVISMASQPSDVLAVHLLMREAGMRAPLPVVPLFETLADLEAAPRVVGELLDTPWFRERAAGELQVMVGYSDSGKDVGRLGAAWALYRAQEELAGLCRARGVRLTLFHGRGGTVARGGGPIYQAVLSQPPGSLDGRLRVTVQGETIESSFGQPALARQSLALYALATLQATLTPPAAPLPRWREVMTRLAEIGASTYRQVVRDDPRFIDYFQAVTPVAELGLLNIGSRPARRGGGGSAGLSKLRAIPWVFAWTQTRLLLPGWLGTGEALATACAEGHAEALAEMASRWPFFRSQLDLVEMVLAKADTEIAAVYDTLLAPAELATEGEALRRRCEAATRWLLRIKGEKSLLEGDAFLARSIALRNPYVDPLNLLQAELLRRLRQQDDPRLRDALLVTINGIAAGMRNTG